MTYRLMINQEHKTTVLTCEDFESDESCLMIKKPVVQGQDPSIALHSGAFPLVNVLSFWLVVDEEVEVSTDQLSEEV